MRILIAGDLLPQQCNERHFENGDTDELLDSELKMMFKNADFRVCNLEGPLTNCNHPIDKSGPLLKGSKESIKGIKAIGIDICSLANNHILDYGEEGYKSTTEVLERSNIRYVGAGDNKQSARHPLIIEKDGIRVGIYSCAEHEFTIATKQTPGANGFDALYDLDEINELKSKVDYVVVLYHGGKEYYRYAVPYVQERCRKMVEKGADLVVCQHSHCIGCHENYNNGEILYGQGNFLFHLQDNEYTHTGLLVQIDIMNKSFKVSYIPCVRKREGVRIASRKERDNILLDFENRSELIKNEQFLEDEYRRFSALYTRSYDNILLGRFSIAAKILYKIGFRSIYKSIYKRRHILCIINVLQCEAHRDSFLHGLRSGII